MITEIRSKYIKKGLKYTIFFFILFSIVFNIKYSILPIPSLILGALMGILCILNKSISGASKVSIRCSHKEYSIFGIFCLLILVCIISSLVNLSQDLHVFSELIIVNFVRLASAYFIIKIFTWSNDGDKNVSKFSTALAICCVVQIIVSYIGFFNPDFYNNVINSLISKSGGLEQEFEEGALGYRPLGIGGYRFFGAGIINGIVLILLSISITQDKGSKKRRLFKIIAYFFIAIGGLAISRTTIIGFFLSIIYLFFSKKKGRIYIAYSILILSILFYSISMLIEYLNNPKIETIYNFGFELINNYLDNGELTTKSTNVMGHMYIFPETLKTWLIGDARIRTESGYYMATDIGFIRIIFAIGLIGLLIFIGYQIYVLYLARNIFTSNRKIIITLFITYLIILNFKGLTDLSLYLFLFFFLGKTPVTKNKKIELKTY